MKVFSNTTPFIALASISRLDLLPRLFGQIHVADEVIDECADLVLMDEKIGRNMAEYLGLKVSGTLGVLLMARKAGLIASFRESAELMRAQGVFYNLALIERLAETVGE